MTRRRTLLAALLLPAAVALTGGCLGGNARVQKPQEGASPQDRTLLRRTALVRPGSALDVENKHPSTLKVLAAEKAREPGTTGECSGVLIAPRLVLTAGHCVCIARQPSESERDALLKPETSTTEQRTDSISRLKSIQGIRIHTLMDSSSCAKTAKVTAIIYEALVPGEENSRNKRISGKVRPHPQFLFLRDEEESVVWSSADLAVILLDRPLSGVPIAKLKMTEPSAQGSIRLTGFGAGDMTPAYGDRHSGHNQITWLRRLDSGSVEIVAALQRLPDGKPGAHLEGGDSGGGCWSSAEDGSEVLIGIAGGAAQNRQGETLSVFTSLYPHEGWLKQHLQEASAE